MELFNLPPEIVVQILSLLDYEFFSKHISHLTICKFWFHVCQRNFHRDITLTKRTLVKFARSEADMARNRPHLRSLHISLLALGETPIYHPAGNATTYITKAQLNHSLDFLGRNLRQCPRLRTLKMTAAKKIHPHPQPGLRADQNLVIRCVASALHVQNLTSLELDIGGDRLLEQHGSHPVHCCIALSASFPTLRRFRCRMDPICEELLKPALENTPPNLEELVINMAIGECEGGRRSARMARICRQFVPSKHSFEGKDGIQEQAMELARKLKNPRIVRVIATEMPYLQIFVLDAMTGRYYELKDDRDFDSLGREVRRPIRGVDEESLFTADIPPRWIFLE